MKRSQSTGPARQRRAGDPGEMLGPRGEHQQQLGIGGHRLVAGRQQQLTDALGERRAARLAGQLHLDAALAQALGQVVAVGALAGPFGPSRVTNRPVTRHSIS